MRTGKRVDYEVKLELIKELARTNKFETDIDFFNAFKKSSTVFNIDGYSIGKSTFKKDLKHAGITQGEDRIFRVSEDTSYKKNQDTFWESYFNVTEEQSNPVHKELLIKTYDGYSEYLAHQFKDMYGAKILGYSALRDCLILYVTIDFAEEFHESLRSQLNLKSPLQK